jgi:hypothetical protein
MFLYGPTSHWVSTVSRCRRLAATNHSSSTGLLFSTLTSRDFTNCFAFATKGYRHSPNTIRLPPRLPVIEAQFLLGRLFGMPDKQKREPVSLLHLPDELLLQVIGDLDRRDLYAVSVQCKRLQRLSLPLYLLHLGVTTPLIFPIDHLVITRTQFSAPGIPLAFFAKNVRRFSCHIGPTLSRFRDPLALQRLHRMIVNIEGLENLALYFNRWGSRRLIDWPQTTEACISLLEVVAKRCTCLTLSRPKQGWASSDVEPVEKEASKWRSGPPRKGLFQALRRCLLLGSSRSQSSHVPETYPHRSYALKTLIFESSTFLLSPFCGWALETLNTAPLTRLDLIKVVLHPRVCTLIFGALTIPTLEHLRIIDCPFEFDTLAEFLSRHNTISTFEIIFRYTSHRQLPITTLPALVSLKSTPDNIGVLLTPTGAFPKLAQVRVVIEPFPHDQSMFDADAVEIYLARAAKRLTKTKIRLCLDVLPASHNGNLVGLRALPNDLGNYLVLSRVREIAFGMPRPDIDATSAIPKWLSLFPLLEHVEFLNGPNDPSRKAKVTLLRRIVQECAGIRSVKIDEETRDTVSWLDEVE